MEEKVSSARFALKWGVILAVGQILFSTALYMTDQMGNAGLSSLSYILIIAVLVMAMRDFRSANNGFMSYGEGLGLSALIGGVSGLLSSAFSVFYTTVIDTEVMGRMVDRVREDLEAKNIPDATIDAQIGMMEKFQSPGFLFIFGIIGMIVMSVIFALVIAAILRKNKPVFE
ncbi:DUF4199 domain-containing protein [Arsenicibacter rosenii]|uniref:DUF4199 domain-containing protein n=1 Tax=Arsenicibacter rosenii TaxID=1750698 RepID=A0A1S2VFZ5_9BACT|nr:DUF4199 domain-containing protein [Arsenicibacter rosenii]OIN57653.1 hypothetical protein BLX24_18045 [Arsenicibacter rosenii]